MKTMSKPAKKISVFQNPRYVAARDLLNWLESNHLDFRKRAHFVNSQDYMLYRFLVSFVVRHKLRFIFYVEHLSNRPVTKLDREALVCLMIGFAQLDDDAKIDAYAAVNETVKLPMLLKKMSLKSFINGVLRNYLRRKEELMTQLAAQPIEIQSSHSAEMVARWKAHFGEQMVWSICNANNLPPVSRL